MKGNQHIRAVACFGAMWLPWQGFRLEFEKQIQFSTDGPAIETFCIDLIIKAVGYPDSLLYKVHEGCRAESRWHITLRLDDGLAFYNCQPATKS